MTDRSPSLTWLWLAVAGVVAIWGASGYVLYDETNRGTFGDMFGAVNALFTGLAFAILIFTVWLQRHELSLQRKELELTRHELQGQKEQLLEQNQTLRVQRFENTFFQLLRVHNDIISAIDLMDEEGHTTKSRDCFRVFYKRLRKIFGPHVMYDTPDDDSLATASRTYLEFYDAHQEEIGHYFRHLYHIIKFVKTSDIDDKRRYTTFVRAQLSSYELALLFYNGLSEHGREKFKPLIEEFALFKNLPPKILLKRTHRQFYEGGAYGEVNAPG